MKAFDFKKERSYVGREQLPVGGYVCQIEQAKVEENDWGSKLSIAFDVCEGEYAGIFARDYKNNTADNKKWRGVFRLNIPKDDGSERDAWAKRAFGNFVWAVEESNPGFAWDWDEKKLKGKKCGFIFRNEEWAMNGRSGWSTKAGGTDSIDNIRAGKFRLLADKPLKNKPSGSFGADSVDDESDLPF